MRGREGDLGGLGEKPVWRGVEREGEPPNCSLSSVKGADFALNDFVVCD